MLTTLKQRKINTFEFLLVLYRIPSPSINHLQGGTPSGNVQQEMCFLESHELRDMAFGKIMNSDEGRRDV